MNCFYVLHSKKILIGFSKDQWTTKVL